MQTPNHPPKLADRLLSWFCKSELLEGIKGDLHEYWERSQQKGLTTKISYWFQVINLLRPFALRRPSILQHNAITMIRFNLLFSWRNMRNNRLYSLLNISGLSLAILSCIFIALYVLHEKSYDQHWMDFDKIHRVTHYNEEDGNQKAKDHIESQVVIGDYLKTDYPEVEAVGRISLYLRRKIAKDNKWIEQDKIGITEQGFLDIFSFNPIHGELKHALKDVNTVVLTESVAKKYFGKSDVVGQHIMLNDSSQYQITCVIEDIPKNSHFQYSAFLNNGFIERTKRTWATVSGITYIKIDPEDRVKMKVSIYDMILEHGAKDWEEAYGITDILGYLEEQGLIWDIDLIPITSIHLHSTNKELELSGKGEYLIILQFIGAFLAFVAIFNFINLSTARASNRLKEIAIKRVLGSQKRQLMTQFLVEAMLYAFFSMTIAIFCSYLLLPEFNALADKSLADPLFNPFELWKLVLPVTIILGFSAGCYPAYHLSRLKTLNAKEVIQKGIKSELRTVCVVLQFTISTMLIFGSIAVLFQLEFLDSKKLGYNHKNTIVFYVDHIRLGQLNEKDSKRILFANELKSSKYFKSVSSSSLVPMRDEVGNTGWTFFSTRGDNEEQFTLRRCQADENLLPTLGFELIKGRNFRPSEIEDRNAVIISESALGLMNLDDPIGHAIYQNYNNKKYTVIGVFKDFNYGPLHRKITPLIISYNPINDYTIAQFESGKSVEAFQEAENVWAELFPNFPISADFMSQLHEKHYAEEKRMGKILLIGTTLAVLIACLGLFGLSTYATEKRKKEIGIRKVLGASRESITGMLVSGFTKPIFVALIIGLPTAYHFSQSWLENFAYRISVGWEIITLAGLLTFVLGILTVASLSYKSASQDPTDNLRYE